jgi:hypothetical protein
MDRKDFSRLRHRCSSPLVIVHDLYLKCVSAPPCETHAILIVNSDAVLSGTVRSKRLQLIPRRHLQVVQRHGGIQNGKFLERPALQIDWKPSALPRLPQPFRFPVPETRGHVRRY